MEEFTETLEQLLSRVEQDAEILARSPEHAEAVAARIARLRLDIELRERAA